MNPSHHPEEALLIDYAAGNLGQPISIVIATHLALCLTCRETAALCEALGGAFLENGRQESADRGSAEAVLDKLANMPEPTASPTLDDHPVFPAPLLARMPGGPSGLRWWPALPGLRVARLRVGASATAVWLLRMKAKATLPRHSHSGLEAICVLAGQFDDSTREYRPGDFAASGSDVEHRATAGPDGCLCVLGLEGPVLFAGPVGWIANVFFKG